MKKLLDLFRHPVRILRYGFARFDEDRHEKDCVRKHGTKQLRTIDIATLFTSEEETIEPFSFLDGTSLLTDILLLKSLARSIKDCHYLEIGSWRGESIANVASVAKKCVSVTLSPDEMRTLNFGEKFVDVHGIFSKDIPNIQTFHANSHTFNFNEIGQKFDLVFIDGDHTYNGVLNDTQKVIPLLRDANSVIVWHDYGYSAETVRYSVLNAILDGLPKEKRQYLYHVSNTMCAIYTERPVSKTSLTTFPTRPDKLFSARLSFKKMESPI